VAGPIIPVASIFLCTAFYEDFDMRGGVTYHGGTYTRLFKTWEGMKQRCYNRNCKEYKYYGARGIVICDEWLDDFATFRDWALANGYTDKLTIDRKNNKLPYEPDNCQFLTKSENVKKQWIDKRRS
jgi:hypothetical protein